MAQKKEKVLSSKRKGFEIKDYKKNIEEEIKDYSTAKFGAYKGNAYMCGSLARLYHNSFYTKQVSKYNLDFKNPFHNNLAQIIETLFEMEDGIEIIDKLFAKNISDKIAHPSKNPPMKGVGAFEAPRGGLYNEVHINEKGIIEYANIITPTLQNLTSIEDSAKALLKQHKDKPRKELEHLLKMLVRAYDPCITCSVH